MNNDPDTYWNMQGETRNPQGNGHSVPQSGSLLRQYSPASQVPPSSPAPGPMMPPPQGWPSMPGSPSSPLSPMPVPQQPGQYMQSQQQSGWPQGGPGGPAWQQPGFFSNAMQTMQRWSGKFAAARVPDVADPNPLVLYRPGVPQPSRTDQSARQARRIAWKRSHALRVSMQMRRRRARWQQSRPTGMKILTISLSVFAVLLMVLVSSGVAYSYSYYQSQYPSVQGVANQQIEQSTRIYDRNGKLLYTAYDGKYGRGTPVSYYEVPGVMQDAMTAAEDHTFWDNTGIDPQGILRAASQYASSGSVQSGGSTITQQVIKNLTHDDQVTLQRKISEARARHWSHPTVSQMENPGDVLQRLALRRAGTRRGSGRRRLLWPAPPMRCQLQLHPGHRLPRPRPERLQEPERSQHLQIQSTARAGACLAAGRHAAGPARLRSNGAGNRQSGCPRAPGLCSERDARVEYGHQPGPGRPGKQSQDSG